MIEVRKLNLRFADKTVLQDFSLKLPDTGVVTLSGPSGCGKTTLARILCFLQKPDSGSIHGIAPGRISMMFQEDRLLPWRSVQDNLRMVMPDEAVEQWLSCMHLADEADAMPGTLSGGMRRRVALARALGYDGELLILDEPFKGLDVELKDSLYSSIRDQAKCRLVLLITHDPDEIRALSDQVIRLEGPPLHILEHIIE